MKLSTLEFIMAQTASPAEGDAAKPATTSESTGDAKQGETEQPAGNPLTTMLPFILIIGVFVVFMVFSSRSRKRQQAQHEEQVLNLEKGARVMLTSGLYATVDKVDKEAREVRIVIDEDKKVCADYNVLAIAKVMETETTTVKKDEEKA